MRIKSECLTRQCLHIRSIMSNLRLPHWTRLLICSIRNSSMGNDRSKHDRNTKEMPRGKQISSSKPAPPLGWRFMEVSLSKAQKEQFKAWKTDLYELFTLVSAYTSQGHKISLSYNNRTSSYISSCTCTGESSPNYGITFTSHGNTPDLALALTLFKLEFILAGMDTWESPVDPDDNWG